MSRRDQRRTNFIVGLFVLAGSALLIFSLFTIAVSEGWGVAKTTITSHFRTVSGLAVASKVQLAGKEIGRVTTVDFIAPAYECNPLTEDFGDPAVRTDDCDPTLFCAAGTGGASRCAELEQFSGSSMDYENAACTGDESCGEAQVCVTGPFRDRYSRVRWSGPSGVCVRYSTELRRVQVTMEVEEDMLEYIRRDSRATVASNGVLGDQLINITVGRGADLGDAGRVQSTPSLMEEINLFKDRFEGITDKVDRGLAGLAGLFGALNDDATKRDLKGIIANAEVISTQLKDGDGLVGALLNDPNYKDSFQRTFDSLSHTAETIDQTTTALQTDIKPAVRNLSGAADEVGTFMASINDPANKSVVARLVHDQEMGQNVASMMESGAEAAGAIGETLNDVQIVVSEVRHSITTAEGTLGKLIKDPKAYDDLVKLLGNAERNNVTKKLIRFLVEQDEFSEAAPPTDARTADKD